jgi:predicted RNase H-like HicB family nuclease
MLPPKEIRLVVEVERETDGRWIADIPEMPGVMAYGKSQSEAVNKAAVLALRVVADRIENDGTPAGPDFSLSLTSRECLAGH